MLTDSRNRSALDLQVISAPAHLHSFTEAVCFQADVHYEIKVRILRKKAEICFSSLALILFCTNSISTRMNKVMCYPRSLITFLILNKLRQNDQCPPPKKKKFLNRLNRI